jgi:prepilin-type N-terminal cleavage/methylation domain-containing protein
MMKRGFTLVELLIVISIIGGLSALFVTTYPNSLRKARDAQRKSDIKQYQTAMEIYASRNNLNYLTATGMIVTHCGVPQLNLANCPDDPRAAAEPTVHRYRIASIPARYVLWARLEVREAGVVNYFIVCSNGAAGESTTQPGGSACPI